MCNHCYIGSTKRFWEKRLEKHLHVSSLTGKSLHGMQIFAPMQHVRSDNCCVTTINREDFAIIGKDENPYILQIKESILISTSRPRLNNNLTSVPIHLFTP